MTKWCESVSLIAVKSVATYTSFLAAQIVPLIQAAVIETVVLVVGGGVERE